MRKIFITILLGLMGLTLTACFLFRRPIELNNKERFETVSFINKSTEYTILDSEIDLYFMENSQLPFVDVKDYLMLLDGVYMSEEFEFVYGDNTLMINVLITYEDKDYSETLTINSDLETIHVTNLSFFDIYLASTETNYGEGLVDLESTISKGSEITFELSNYNFEVLLMDDRVYLPLVITNLIFNQSNYFDTYYNGESLYGIDTSQLEDNNIKTLITSKYNNNEVPEDLILANYHFYRFLIDYFYGLKEERNIVKSEDFISKDTFVKGDVERNIFNVVTKLDDLHTSHLTRGYYNNPKQMTTYFSLTQGANIKKFYDGVREVQSEATSYFGIKNNMIDFFDYEYIDNDKTLIIYVLSFTVDTPGEIEEIIKSAHPNTKNIIIDLSFNTGGNLGAVLRMFTLMTNETIEYHFKNPLDGATGTYRVRGEKAAYNQFNYYFKISSITYSAANLTASIAKELGFGVIGRESSGGASAINFFVFPTGSIIIMSSNSVLTDKEYQSIEYGIEPDYLLEGLYNKNEIINAIKNLQK